MSQFTKGLIVKWLPEESLFKVLVSFKYHVGSEDSKEIVQVAMGFKTDLASIPPIARWIIPKLGKHAQAAVLHDFMYRHHTYKRSKCDKVFLEAMKVLKVAFWKRHVMYRAVRLGGGFVWEK